MNSKMETMLSLVTKLDSWDIQAVLGGVNFMLRQTALNQAIRMLPEAPPEGSGLEYFADWDARAKSPEITKQVSPLVGMAERVTDVLESYTQAQPSNYYDVITFLVGRPPAKSMHIREYDQRKKQGLKPNMSLNDFVEMEYAEALRRHATLIAKGEHAARVLSSIDGSDEDPGLEWLDEALHNKVIQKLNQRWMRAEVRRTNPRLSSTQRTEAVATQQLIRDTIETLGGELTDFDAEEAASAEIDEGIKRTKEAQDKFQRELDGNDEAILASNAAARERARDAAK